MRIYFLSICGTGMGNGALLMRSLGHEVYGADQNTYPPMSDRLLGAGITILEGYDAERLKRLNPDLVVVGNVNTRGNPEVEWLLDTCSMPFVSLPQLLSSEILQKRKTIVVSGTHGKTTTAALVACLLRGAGTDPGYLIGGVPGDLPSGAHAGLPEAPFVIEGDEYDSAFFDKRSKFIHYCPRVLLINNLEFDHADIFRDLEDVKRSFRHLLKLVPNSGHLIVNGDDPALADILEIDWCPIFRVGLGEGCDLRIAEFEENEAGSSFELVYLGIPWTRIWWPQWGLFNARNAAMAALGAAFGLGLEDPKGLDLQPLRSYRGVKRRQETLVMDEKRIVMLDFAHHPTAVRGVLESLRPRFPGWKLVACFEPRSNTACRNIHEAAFEGAFGLADEVHLAPVFRAERYTDEERINLQGMAERLGDHARAYNNLMEMETALRESMENPGNRLYLFLSNGAFAGLPQRLAGLVQARPDRSPGIEIDP